MKQTHQPDDGQPYPPFSETTGIFSASEIILPQLIHRGFEAIQPQRDLHAFLSTELLTPKLNALHQRLWLAGLPIPARNLQRQRLMNRDVLLTERPDEHLVWNDGCIFIKPLPDFLLCHAFWDQHLCHYCDRVKLFESAAGFLLSYTWLIQYPSDFEMARSLCLIPAGLNDYVAWTSFVGDFLSYVDSRTAAGPINPRYKYGELRLTRLNSLTRFLPSMWSARNLVYGHMHFSTRHKAFFDTNFGWLLAIFAYISVVLSAIQAGLGTDYLAGSVAFQRMSYGLTLAAIVAAVGSAIWLLLVFLILFAYHLTSTYLFVRRVDLAKKSFRKSPSEKALPGG